MIDIYEIKTALTKVADMIAAFEAQSNACKITFDAVSVTLNPGEEYAGIVLGKDGEQSHHLVLLPGEFTGNWNAAMEWAAQVGGELPTRREQSLLFANLKEKFDPVWHWSCEQYAGDSDYAWIQVFNDGGQYGNGKDYEGRARAIKRIPVNQTNTIQHNGVSV